MEKVKEAAALCGLKHHFPPPLCRKTGFPFCQAVSKTSAPRPFTLPPKRSAFQSKGKSELALGAKLEKNTEKNILANHLLNSYTRIVSKRERAWFRNCPAIDPHTNPSYQIVIANFYSRYRISNNRKQNSSVDKQVSGFRS